MRRGPLGVVLAAVMLCALAPYLQTLGFDFVGLDDRSYVSENPWVRAGLTGEGIRWAFTSGHMGIWHPLTWLSHMLDVELFGVQPGGHHAVNLGLHALNAGLLFALLARATGSLWRSAAAAALFAAHPLRVEAVAWVSERKELLGALFGLLALHAYMNAVRQPGAPRMRGPALFLAGALLAKPTWVSLPLLCLLLDFWPLGRWRTPKGAPVLAAHARTLWRLALEKWPLFALAAAASVAAVWAQRSAGAVPDLAQVALGERLANAVMAYARYLGKTFWPLHLSPHYLHPASPGGVPPSALQQIGALVLLGGISLAVVRLRRCRYLVVGWLWYGISLLPMIGLVQVGSQALADRYTYLPAVGLTLALVWAGADAVGRLPTTAWRRAAVGAAMLVVGALELLSLRQAAVWRDSVTLYERALAQHRSHPILLNNLGDEYRRRGQLERAIALFREALAIDPAHWRAYNNLGLALLAEGRTGEAEAAFREALRLRPGEAAAASNLGNALLAEGRLAEARAAYETALRLDPELAEAYNNLGVTLQRSGDLEGARAAYERALALRPWYADAHGNLGALLERRGDREAALRHLRKAVEHAPRSRRARVQLAEALRRRGRLDEAIHHYRVALELGPRDARLLRRLAETLRLAGRPEEAAALERGLSSGADG